MKEWEYEQENYGLKYTVTEGEVYVTSLSGNPMEVVVPEEIDGKKVAGLHKKVFLSKKNLKRVTLPGKLKSIGDYAFAFCSRLEEVVFPDSCPEIGKNIFQDCFKLKGLWSGWSEDGGSLLAAAVTTMETYYLLTPENVGSREWYEKWDQRLEMILCEDDQEGYLKQILCGEEDYGSTDLNAFMGEKRKRKIRLSFLRLLHPDFLPAARKEILENYIINHTKGMESDESWQVVHKEYYDNRAHIQLFLDLGCINSDNIDSVLNEIGPEHVELKTTILRYKEEQLSGDDFFGNLML